MKKFFTKCLSIILIVVITLSAGSVGVVQTRAVTFESLNASDVFIKQEQGSGTCTLCSTVMMMRRYSLLRGDSKWRSITEKAVKPTAWKSGVGLLFNFKYESTQLAEPISVTHGYFDSSKKESQIQALLKKHPEGIVIYNTSAPHAVLLTDYTNGVYYCADPASGIAKGRIPLKNSYKVSINNVSAYWVISSSTVSGVTNANTLTIKYNANGGIISGSDKTYNIYSVATTSGINMRSGAGTGYGVLQVVPVNASFYVTDTAKANGYTWGKTTYNEKTGWVVISENWTKKTGTRPQTKYYLDSNNVYKSSNKKVLTQAMVQGTTYEDGLYNASTLGISKTGYTFAGWGTKADGGTIYDQNASQTAEKLYSNIKNGDKTITLYAQWIPNTLNVNFNANGGSISSDTYKLSSDVVYKKSTSSKHAQKWTYNNKKDNGLTNASTLGLYKTGYTFAGWGTKASGGTIFDQDNKDLVPTSICSDIKKGSCSITLYAQWVPNTLSVYYNANGGTVSSDTYKLSSNVIYKKSDSTKYAHKWTYNNKKDSGLINASTFGLSRPGYKFVGWGTKADGGTVFNQNNVDLVPTSINSNIKNGNCSITLYAIWEAKT